MNVRALSARKAIVAVSLVASGLVLGGTASVVTTANATESSTTSSSVGSHSGETALTGTVLAKVRAAITAKYPSATFDRVETDSDGVYEAHITTAAGDDLTVQVDKSFAITGTE